MFRKKVYFNKKCLYVNSIRDLAVADNEMLHIFKLFSTFGKVLINMKILVVLLRNLINYILNT